MAIPSLLRQKPESHPWLVCFHLLFFWEIFSTLQPEKYTFKTKVKSCQSSTQLSKGSHFTLHKIQKSPQWPRRFCVTRLLLASILIIPSYGSLCCRHAGLLGFTHTKNSQALALYWSFPHPGTLKSDSFKLLLNCYLLSEAYPYTIYNGNCSTLLFSFLCFIFPHKFITF